MRARAREQSEEESDAAHHTTCTRIVAGWDRINKNGDAYVCMKPYPHTPGSPAYLFNGTDNNAT